MNWMQNVLDNSEVYPHVSHLIYPVFVSVFVTAIRSLIERLVKKSCFMDLFKTNRFSLNFNNVTLKKIIHKDASLNRWG